ncbi:hypothetical protein F1654_09970 [Alkalicaulis satelles]|uniref:Glycine zipper 2TM domain-containing protein n=1 Tax=Alkalicaulis satelles TaxID=2609175 RepID=A0A5M6ZPD8_9PROT|nr:hypothetical protein [Alkalicaulis satelles]KAA5804091.1 hypothetical protein F1654_09970 [Alkalicaulis satelles]
MLRELNLDEVGLVAGGFRFGEDDNGGSKPEPEKESESVDDNPWWNDNDDIILGSLIGGVIGAAVCSPPPITKAAPYCAMAGAAAGGYIANRDLSGDGPASEAELADTANRARLGAGFGP